MTTVQLSSPSTGEPFATWQESGPDAVADAVARARRASRDLRALSRWERCDLLVSTARCLAARRADTVEALLVEHGKVRAEAEAEVDTAIHGFEMVAEYARRLDGSIPVMSDPAKRVLVQRTPLGVVGVITPWNFPVNIPVEYLAPALAMGNAVVWKPAESTPLSSAHLLAALGAAGWPDGAVVHVGGGPRTGEALVAEPGLDAIGFTGSSEVGRRIAAVGGMRSLLLELGGNGPTVVFADVDPAVVAARVTDAAVFCSGQSCAATERVLVHTDVYDDVVEAMAAEADRRRVGAPEDPTAAFGPLHLDQTAETVRAHVDDAVRRGARLVRGGAPDVDAPTDRYWPLTVLADVDDDARVFADETFGPVLPLARFDDEASLAARVAASPYGLNGAVFTRDLERAFRVAESLPCGSVVVNDHSNVWETHLPFGGHPGTASGVGRIGGAHALEALSAVRTLIVDVGGHGGLA